MTIEGQVQPGSFPRLLLWVVFLAYLSIAMLLEPAYIPFGLLLVAGGVYLTYRVYRFYRQRTDG